MIRIENKFDKLIEMQRSHNHKLDMIFEVVTSQNQTKHIDTDEYDMPLLPCASVDVLEKLNVELHDEQYAKFLVSSFNIF
jgi:rubrerythrin